MEADLVEHRTRATTSEAQCTNRSANSMCAPIALPALSPFITCSPLVVDDDATDERDDVRDLLLKQFFK